jgi:hypothetical protein
MQEEIELWKKRLEETQKEAEDMGPEALRLWLRVAVAVKALENLQTLQYWGIKTELRVPTYIFPVVWKDETE